MKKIVRTGDHYVFLDTSMDKLVASYDGKDDRFMTVRTAERHDGVAAYAHQHSPVKSEEYVHVVFVGSNGCLEEATEPVTDRERRR
ncbi:hypothetical protein [Methanomassiliicoccus luminyensis]|uniref:hypothetical protein n=1 Tax=Methanomassiliicoccus luminyensis TaxID=1080712 RepID=UPI0003786D6E|nr:hypothetical protein [Methanomassiliicoccus luminyensis]